MKIPKSFQCAAKTYRVKLDHDRRLSEQNLVGQCDYPSCLIKLNLMDKGIKQSLECVQHVYLHEVWHVIWGALGEESLRKSERLADSFCELLLQVLNSGKGELKICSTQK